MNKILSSDYVRDFTWHAKIQNDHHSVAWFLLLRRCLGYSGGVQF